MVRGLGVPVLRLMPAPVVILMPLDATVGKNAMECFRIRTIQRYRQKYMKILILVIIINIMQVGAYNGL